MEDRTMLHIAAKINKAAKADGVCAEVDFEPIPDRSRPDEVRIWDIKLTYNNYNRVERFDSGVLIDDVDADRIASNLLKGLFADYFDAKLGLDA
jgi:hypothetical protein